MYYKLAKALFNRKDNHRDKFFIKKHHVHQFLYDILELLYPHFNQNFIQNEDSMLVYIKKAELNLLEILHSFIPHKKAIDVTSTFFENLESIRDLLDMDAEAISAGDPAAKNMDEVIFCYPGLFAIAVHRIAHLFYQENVPTLPRIFSEYAHQITGVDINPGATIGKYFFIDHATGIVIGETAIIGDHVKMYQGVTLGALSVDKKLENNKRHPTIEDNCVIYSNATILGGDTIIGTNSIIGGNVWLVKSVPANSIVYHKSEVKFDYHKKDSSFNDIE